MLSHHELVHRYRRVSAFFVKKTAHYHTMLPTHAEIPGLRLTQLWGVLVLLAALALIIYEAVSISRLDIHTPVDNLFVGIHESPRTKGLLQPLQWPVLCNIPGIHSHPAPPRSSSSRPRPGQICCLETHHPLGLLSVLDSHCSVWLCVNNSIPLRNQPGLHCYSSSFICHRRCRALRVQSVLRPTQP
jgi:hypothetical protein